MTSPSSGPVGDLPEQAVPREVWQAARNAVEAVYLASDSLSSDTELIDAFTDAALRRAVPLMRAQWEAEQLDSFEGFCVCGGGPPMPDCGSSGHRAAARVARGGTDGD